MSLPYGNCLNMLWKSQDVSHYFYMFFEKVCYSNETILRHRPFRGAPRWFTCHSPGGVRSSVREPSDPDLARAFQWIHGPLGKTQRVETQRSRFYVLFVGQNCLRVLKFCGCTVTSQYGEYLRFFDYLILKNNVLSICLLMCFFSSICSLLHIRWPEFVWTAALTLLENLSNRMIPRSSPEPLSPCFVCEPCCTGFQAR